MKIFLTFITILFLSTGCKPKVLSGQELKNKLVETMDGYLHKTLQPGITYSIKDVAFYPEADKMQYRCEFTVTMNIGNRDTTGIVSATISNDFKKVDRKQ